MILVGLAEKRWLPVTLLLGLTISPLPRSLETLHAGVIRKGAQEGTYKARILLGDDEDRVARKKHRGALNAKYTKFETSGLECEVKAGSNEFPIKLDRPKKKK